MKLTIFIPCFNEKRTILKAIEEAKGLKVDKEIIVIDNASTDGTRELLYSLKKEKNLKIVLHSRNLGVGYSAIECINMAMGEYFYAPYADLEYKMEDVYNMLSKIELENLDAVFGSRLLLEKNKSKIALIKERPFWLGSIIATLLVNLLYGRRFTDTIATKVIKTDILKSLGCSAYNQAFEFELVSRLCRRGCKIQEVPIYYKPRGYKEGKTVKVWDMIPAIWAIIKVKFSK